MTRKPHANTKFQTRQKRKEAEDRSSAACQAYGHNYEKDFGKSLKLPPGYIIEVCSWCGDQRSVMEYGI